MKHTTNYNLNKIELTDSPPDITALNPNFDTIDAQLKNLNDKDTEIVASIDKVKTDYLPTKGGTMTSGDAMKRNVTNSHLSFYGGTANKDGAQLVLCGEDHTTMPSYFRVLSRNESSDVALEGRPDGTLKWDSKNILRSINGKTADASGNLNIDFGVGNVQSVNGVTPDDNGNVTIETGNNEEILEAANRVTDVEVDASVAQVEALQQGLAHVEASYLPLEGGTMTGSIALMSGDNSLVAPTDNGYIEIEGGTAFGKGASLTLYGKDSTNTSGCFKLFANKGQGHTLLLGDPDGSLTWGGSEVVTAYEAGDTVSGTFWGCATLTGSTQKIVCQIPHDRPINATNATVTATTVNVRQNGKYLIQNQDATSYIDGVYLYPHGLEVNFWNASGWGGTNNDVVSIAIIYTITFS